MSRDRQIFTSPLDPNRHRRAVSLWLKAGFGVLALTGAAIGFTACFEPDEETLYACAPDDRKCPDEFVCHEADWCCHPEGDIDPERLNGCGFDGTPGEGTGASSSSSGGSDSGSTTGGTTETGGTGDSGATGSTGTTGSSDTTGTDSGATGTSTGTGW